MSRLDTALSHRVGHEEEVELAVNYLRLLNKALVDICTLGRVVDESLPVLLRLLKESLTDPLIYNNERYFGRIIFSFLTVVEAVLFLDDFVQLFELKVDHLLAHRVADTVTVDEDVVWHCAFVEVAVALERSHEVV